jgi:hypothetical protein
MPKKSNAVHHVVELDSNSHSSSDDGEQDSGSDESSFGGNGNKPVATKQKAATTKKSVVVPPRIMISSSSNNRNKEKGDSLSTTNTATATNLSTDETTTLPVVSPTGTDEFTVVLPSSWMATGNPPTGECNLLIQIDPEDATRLDYDGVSGAIGRFEAGDNGILIDLKGRQYHGSILPGPTAMLVSLAKGLQLRVEGVTDEFATVVQTSDVMAKLDAIVTGAELDDGYRYVEENVNRVDRSKQQQQQQQQQIEGATSTDKGPKKRTTGSSKPAAKRRKKTTT